MKTMKRLLALLLALSMVMPNCLTIASAYSEEIVEEVVEELAEETVETPEEVVEEVFEEVIEEEIYEEVIEEEIVEEVISEEVTEEVVEEVIDLSSSSDVAADQVQTDPETETISFSYSDPDAEDDSEEQFAAYANAILYPGKPVTLGTDGYAMLAEYPTAKEIYDLLKGTQEEPGYIVQIANGTRTSTVIELSLENALDKPGLDALTTALLMDMPYNLYWYDKTEGVQAGLSPNTSGGYTVTLSFNVASAYSASGEAGTYVTDQKKTGATIAAAEYAQSVATSLAFAAYDGDTGTPYGKLMAYVEWIKNAVAYDHTAANGGNTYYSTQNSNPWQLIWVFDRNEDGTLNTGTNVVCEGYSKALQYLCDYAESQNIDVPHVFSVTGDSYNKTNGTGGRHMWNIAVMDDGKNYLVDVTNADPDEGTGWDSILRGAPAVTGNYTYIGKTAETADVLQHTVKLTAGNSSIDLLYAYDQETLSLFDGYPEEITLAETDYEFKSSADSAGDSVTDITTAEALMALMEPDEDGNYVLNQNAVVTGDITLPSSNVYTISYGVTLTVASGAALTVAEMAQLNVNGTLDVAGTLTNNWSIMVNGGSLNVTGTLNNNRGMELQSPDSSVTVTGTYNRGSFQVDGVTYPADFGVLCTNDGKIASVSGVDGSNLTVYSYGNDPKVFAALAALCEGDNAYSNYIINLDGETVISENTKITEKGLVRLWSGAKLVLNATLTNNGTFVARAAGTNPDGVEDENSLVDNNGILENGANGTMKLLGDYTHNGELKVYTRLEGTELVYNDIQGEVDKNLIAVITHTDSLDVMDKGFALGKYFGQAQVHMTGTPTFNNGLYLGGNYDLHIYGNATINGDVVVEGGQLQVEPGASLTTNNEIALLGGARMTVHSGAELVTNDAVWINGGSYIGNKGTWNANKPIHIGYQNQINAPVSGTLDVDGTLNTYEYVNVCEGAALNINGTMTQMPYDETTKTGGVIIENHGAINVNGTLNQNHDIENYGQLVVSGSLNNVSGNVWNNKYSLMTLSEGSKPTGFDRYNQIMVYDGAMLTNEGADLSGMEGASINVRMDDDSTCSGFDDSYIYAVWFPNNTAELIANIAESENGTKYGFTEFIPEASFTLTENITIYGNSLLQLWNFDEWHTYTVTVPNGITLTVSGEDPNLGQIIINSGTQLVVEDGGRLVNSGIVQMTDNNRGNEALTPGILRLHDKDCFAVSCSDTNHDHTPQPDGGFLVYGTMTEAELETELANATGWVHESFTQVEENLVIDKPFYLDDKGCIVVPSGTKLTINSHVKVIGGKLELQSGSSLVMGEGGVLELVDGVVYVADGAIFPDGDYRGSAFTFESGEGDSSTDSYLSTYWVHNFGEGAFVNHDYQENRAFRMVPGEKYSWIFYYNEWDPNNLTWSRRPVHPNDLNAGDYVKIEPASNYDWLAEARSDYEHLKDYFVMVSIEDVADAWNKGTVVRYQYDEGENDYVDYSIDICRDSERGFYKEADATNGNWLFEVQTAPIFADEDGTKSFYFIYTREGHTISNVALNTEDSFATLTKVEDKTNVWKITLSKDYVDSLWNHKIERDDRLEVTYTETNSSGSWQNSTDIGIQAIWPTVEAGFTLIDKNDVFEGYNYDAETGKWIDTYDGGWRIIEGLPEGITYDYESNTLTLNDVQLNGMHLDYWGENGETYLPNPNLTINLVGESTIANHGVGTSLHIRSGVKATITGDGILNLGSTNAGSINTAIDVTPESTLTLAGGTINTENAHLMLGGLVTIGGATVNTEGGEFRVDKRLDLISGNVNVTAWGRMDDKGHTHTNGIQVGPGCEMNVKGGAINITVPAVEGSHFYHGIQVQEGKLNISGGTVTIDGPENTWGYGIKLDNAYNENGPIVGTKSYFNMSGGKLIVKEALIMPDEDMPTAIWGNGDAEVTVSGGEMDLETVYVDLNGKTTWNGGTVNAKGVLFFAGGESFVINDGTFNLTGDLPDGYNALFRAGGMVQMNGGNLNITNGVLGVPTSFELNGGSVTITNDENYADCWGVYVGNCLSVNGGTLTVNVPGGKAPVGFEGKSPAMQVDGKFHQMGGTVTLTSASTAAIRSFGTVLLNDGALNLSGTYGIGQINSGAEDYKGTFEVSGGELTINATDTGIYAEHSTVRFVTGVDKNGFIISEPTVTIRTQAEEGVKTAAIQVVTASATDSGVTNDYTFCNDADVELKMEAAAYTDGNGGTYYAHTLMDGEDYATNAKLTQAAIVIKEQADLDAQIGNATGFFRTGRNWVIEGDVTIQGINFLLVGEGTMTIKNGATLTIQQVNPEDTALVAQGNSRIIVEPGAKIYNDGILASDVGTIEFKKSETEGVGAYEATNRGVLRKHYQGDGNIWGTVENLDISQQSIVANVFNGEQLLQVIGEMNKGYKAASIYTWDDMSTFTGTTTLPANTSLFVAEGKTLTVPAGAKLILSEGSMLSLEKASLGINGEVQVDGEFSLSTVGANIQVADNGVLTLNSNVNLSRWMEDGPTSALVVAPTADLVNNAVLNISGGSVLTVNGEMTNNGTINAGQQNGAVLNVTGQLYNYGQLNLDPNEQGGVQMNLNGQLYNRENGVITNNALILVPGALNLEGGELKQNGILLISGMANITGNLDNNGRTVLEGNDNGGAHMIVKRGGRLDLVDRGQFHIESGAVLTNGELDENYNVIDNSNGDVRIRMGTLYIMSGGEIQGPWDGHATWENGTDTGSTQDHLTAWSLNNPDGNGWYVELGWNESWDERIVPGDERWMVVYQNIWHADPTNGDYYWERTPVVPTSTDETNLKVELVREMEGQTIAEGVDGSCFLHVTAGGTWGVDAGLTYNKLTYPVRIGTDVTHGFYDAASNGNWLETIEVDNLAAEPKDAEFYYVLTAGGWELTGEHWLDGVPEDITVNTAYQNDGKSIKVTIPAESVKALSQNFHLTMNVKVRLEDGTSDEEHWSFGASVNCTQLHEIPTNVWMRINGQEHNYSSAYDKWITWNGESLETVDLQGRYGLDYDYETNTLTMTNADLYGMQFGYFALGSNGPIVDENGNYVSCDLPNENLTLKLVGNNTIRSHEDHNALRIERGVKMTITSDSDATLRFEGGIYDESTKTWGTAPAVELGGSGCSLTISGNANVTVAVLGKNNGDRVSAMNGNGGSLTVTGNATLTTALPDGALRYDNIKGTGGYGGIDNFRVTVAENATVNTQFIGTDSYTQTGGTVNITAQGGTGMEDKYEWDEEKQQNVYVKTVEHTHFDGIHTNGGTVSISGGNLNITIPDNATTESTYFRGIAMDSGTLNITGGTVTVDSPAGYYGNGIALSCAYNDNGPVAGTKTVFKMDGGKLVMKEAIFSDYGMATAIWGDGNAEVTINGGEMDLDAVCIELNGKTTWNNGVVNGEELIFKAGGTFLIKDGTFTMTGAPIPGNTEIYSNALFRANGMVTMEGGTMNITNGVLGVPTSFTLNGGTVTVTNNREFADCWGVYVGNYLSVNGGELNVHVPGGSYTYPETDESSSWTEVYPAVKVEGTLHQRGGTVNITSDTTYAIQGNYGSVLLNNGTMNLSGFNGIEMIGNAKYGENSGNNMLFVSGGTLNIDVEDTGILSRHSSVRFVQGGDDKGNVFNPSVTIHSGAGALQLLTYSDSETAEAYINEYTFVNASGDKVAMMGSKNLTATEEVWVHTLMNGDKYATNVSLKQQVVRTERDFWTELENAAGTFQLTYDVTIESTDRILTKPVEVVGGAELTIAPGAVLTLQKTGTLAAVDGGKITVEADGKLVNDGSQLCNRMGIITIRHGAELGYEAVNYGEMIMQTISTPTGLAIGTTSGWPYADQTLAVTCANLDQYYWAVGITTSMGFGGTFVDMYSDIMLDKFLTIPENVTVSFNSPVKLSGGVDNDTEISTMTVPANVTLTINGGLFINNGSVLDVESGAVLNNYGGLHIGDWQNGKFAVSGTMNVRAGATVNLYGYTCMHMFNAGTEEEPNYIPGVMNVYGTVNAYAANENYPGGYIQNGGILNVENGGEITSYWLFDTNAATNVNTGGKVTLHNGMMITGELNVAGELTNQDGVMNVGFVDESARFVTGKLNVTGKLTNKSQISIFDAVTVSGELDNDAGVFLARDGASLTGDGAVNNSASISTQINKATINLTGYTQEYQEMDGERIYGELVVDYFADGSVSNVTVSDMKKVTLRYAGSSLEELAAMKEKAATLGCGNTIWTVTENVTIEENTTLEVAAGSYLVVAPGVTLTVNGTLQNQGSLMLSKRGGSDLSGAMIIGEKGKIVNVGTIGAAVNSTLTNNGTIEMLPDAKLNFNGTYTAGEKGTLRLGTKEIDGTMGTVTGIDKKYQTIVTEINNSSQNNTALAQLNRALAVDASAYAAMEIHLTIDLEAEADLTIAEKQHLIIGFADPVVENKDGSTSKLTQPTVTITGTVTNNGTITNYGELFISNELTGTVNNQGMLCAGGAYSGVCGPNLTWKLTVNTNAVTRTTSSGTLVISGTGEMTDDSWNRLDDTLLASVTNIKLSNQMTNILDGAFTKFTGVSAIVIPKSVTTVSRAGFVTEDVTGVPAYLTLRVYHTFDRTKILGINMSDIHELFEDPYSKTTKCSGCSYTPAKMATEIADAKTTEAKIEVLNQVDTTTLKDQMEVELTSTSGESTVTTAIKNADDAVKSGGVDVGPDNNSQQITVPNDGIMGAALSASEESKQVTLVVNDVAEAPEPEKVPDVYTTHAAEDSVSVDMTLTGVDDPENLTAPVTITVNKPQTLIGNFKIVHHGINGADPVEYKDNGDGTITFTLDSFSVVEFLPEAVAYVETTTRTHASLASAIEKAAPGETVTLLADYTGPSITVNKNLTIVPNGRTLDNTLIVAGAGFDKKVNTDGIIEIFTVEAKCGDTKYTTLEEAIVAAGENGTVTLLRSVEREVTVSKAVTITKNGCTANLKADGNLVVGENADRTAYVVGAAAVQLNGTGYADLQAALDTAQDGDTITLLTGDFSGSYTAKSLVTIITDKNINLNAAGARIVTKTETGYQVIAAKAQIGTVYYASLTDALKAEGDTITLLANEDATIQVTKPVTILKNGFTAKLAVDTGMALDEITDENNVSKYVIAQAVAKHNNAGYATVEGALNAAKNTGNDTITLLKDIETETPIIVNQEVNIVTNGFHVTLVGGEGYTLSVTKTGLAVVQGASKAKIGEIGYATLNDALAAAAMADSAQTITLLEGVEGDVQIKQVVTINTDGKNATLSTTSEYAMIQTDNVYQFVVARAKIGDTGYATLTDALKAANETDIIVLLDVPDEDEKIDKAVKINLNGKTETVPVATGWVAVEGESGIWTVEMKLGSIRLRNASLNLLDKVAIIYKATDDTIAADEELVVERGVLLYDSAEKLATKDPAQAMETIVLEWNETQERYVGQSKGIDARDMDKSQFAVAYLKMTDGTYIFGTKDGVEHSVEYSPLIYCKKTIANVKTTEVVANVCNALMQYGAAAQVAQYGKTGGLMNEGFAEVAYDANVLGETVFSANTAVTNGIKLRAVTMDLKGAVSYIVKFTVEDASISQPLYAEYELLGKTGNVKLVTGSDGLLRATIEGIAPKDLDETLRVKAYYLNDNSEKVYGGELVYSGYEYIRRAQTNTSYSEADKALSRALAMYIHYADAYAKSV